jgi:hypothetical protein
MRSPRHQEQTTIMARMLSLLGAVPPAAGLPGQQLVLPDPERAQLICFGYEMYCAHVTDRILTFEHTILLAKSLIASDYLMLDNCFECDGLVISEHFAKGLKRCSYCGTR